MRADVRQLRDVCNPRIANAFADLVTRTHPVTRQDLPPDALDLRSDSLAGDLVLGRHIGEYPSAISYAFIARWITQSQVYSARVSRLPASASRRARSG